MSKTVIRCVAVGDGFVGKTSFLSRLSGKNIRETYSTTIFENSSANIYYKNAHFELFLVDTAGQEDYNMLRYQAYVYGDIFLLCYSIDNMDSFINIREKWIPEVRKCINNPKFILVGLKNDLKTDPEAIEQMHLNKTMFVNSQNATNLAQQLGISYIECSSKTQETFQEIAELIIEVGLQSTVPDICDNPNCSNFSVTSFLKRFFCCEF